MADQGGLQRRQGGFRSVDWRDIVKRKLISCSNFDHTAFSKSCHRVQKSDFVGGDIVQNPNVIQIGVSLCQAGPLGGKDRSLSPMMCSSAKRKERQVSKNQKTMLFHFQENIIPTYPRCWPRNQETENHDFSLLPRETFAWFPKFPKMGFVRLRVEQQRPLLFVTCFKFMVGKVGKTRYREIVFKT